MAKKLDELNSGIIQSFQDGYESDKNSIVNESSVNSVVNVETEEEKKRGRKKSDKEIKKRISLLLRPSLYEEVGKVAFMNRISVSEQISRCLEELVESEQEKIKKYDEQ